jgi:hypothetical protein
VRPAAETAVRPHHRRVAMADGISLHADTAVRVHDRQGLEQLCRYGARGPLAQSRLNRRDDGTLSYRMKRPVRGRHVLLMTPLQLLKKLAAVTPPRGKHLVHFHGMFAPAASHRSAVVAYGRAPPAPAPVEPQASLPLTPAPFEPRPRPPRLDWATLLRKTRYPVGARVRAYYNPANAADAALTNTGSGTEQYLLLGIGALVALLALPFLYLARRMARRAAVS